MKLETDKSYGLNKVEDGHKVFTIPLPLFKTIDEELQGSQEDLKAYMFSATTRNNRILPSKIKEIEFSILIRDLSGYRNKAIMILLLHGPISHVLGCEKCHTQKA